MSKRTLKGAALQLPQSVIDSEREQTELSPNIKAMISKRIKTPASNIKFFIIGTGGDFFKRYGY